MCVSISPSFWNFALLPLFLPTTSVRRNIMRCGQDTGRTVCKIPKNRVFAKTKRGGKQSAQLPSTVCSRKGAGSLVRWGTGFTPAANPSLALFCSRLVGAMDGAALLLCTHPRERRQAGGLNHPKCQLRCPKTFRKETLSLSRLSVFAKPFVICWSRQPERKAWLQRLPRGGGARATTCPCPTRRRGGGGRTRICDKHSSLPDHAMNEPIES